MIGVPLVAIEPGITAAVFGLHWSDAPVEKAKEITIPIEFDMQPLEARNGNWMTIGWCRPAFGMSRSGVATCALLGCLIEGPRHSVSRSCPLEVVRERGQ